MIGMDRNTGKPLTGMAHIIQSLMDIITTPIGSRVMRRAYGSYVFKLLDAPLTGVTRLLLSAYTASAVARWETRVKLRKVSVTAGDSGGASGLTLEGYRVDLPIPQFFSTFIPL